MTTLRVLGIDPGSNKCGWGVVEPKGPKLTHVAADVVRAPKGKPLSQRLARVHAGLAAAIAEHRPTAVAIEEVFYAKHASAAIGLAHARGVALLAAAEAGLPVFAYAPSLVKRSVAGKGRASKDQVGLMVGAILGIRRDALPPEDACDALAIAITHAQAARIGLPGGAAT